MDGQHGGDEGVGAGDDFVARAHAAGHQRHLQRLQPVGHGQAVPDATESRKFLLEQPHVLAQDEIAARADLLHGGIHLRFDLLILPDQIDKLNLAFSI